ncbi:CoA transferase [Diaphorobacter aerolatus]|uniref:CoA transferase n=1 Tax=Diaphorobacter aerolatus TaxID=1288495 RepID=A0A7H0GJR4_9BURK|nr:CoA transferase [Diaphorobacter aerolatus]QNP48530.1 CoA transferase [Diaphorobacter aerolatus]
MSATTRNPHDHHGADAPCTAQQALSALWQQAGLPMQALERAHLHGVAMGFPSSFAVDVAAQTAVAAAALAASEIERLRSPASAPQRVSVDVQHALAESTGYFTLDGERPPVWSPVSGLYACGEDTDQPGHVRIHANFAHHRDGALRLLGLPEGEGTTREQVRQALRRWTAVDFESQATQAGLVVAAVRTSAEWLASPVQAAIAAQELVGITRVADAKPLAWPAHSGKQRPLAGLKVLDLTRILAGPVGARTLAAYGADVLMINSPHLPNIEAIADVSRGKRSAWLDLKDAAASATMRRLLQEAHVFIQGYRPGGLQRLGLGVSEVAQIRPGIVYASLSAYGREGPWADKRGFDSLVQTVSGINSDEAAAFQSAEPRALPMQTLDYCAGFLLAFGVQVALMRQAGQGGTWHVQVSLARVAQWLRQLGRRPVAGQGAPGKVDERVAPWLRAEPSGFGALQAVTHAGMLSATPSGWDRPSVPREPIRPHGFKTTPNERATRGQGAGAGT